MQYLHKKSEQEYELRKAELEIKKKVMEDKKEVDMSLHKQHQQQFRFSEEYYGTVPAAATHDSKANGAAGTSPSTNDG